MSVNVFEHRHLKASDILWGCCAHNILLWVCRAKRLGGETEYYIVANDLIPSIVHGTLNISHWQHCNPSSEDY